MLDQALIARYHRDGFVNGGPLLDADTVEALKAETLRVIDDRERSDRAQPSRCLDMGQGGHPLWQIVNIWQASPAFDRLVHHPKLAEAVAAITGADEIRLWHDQIQYKPATTGGVNMWHQDNPYWPNLRPASEQVTAWIALDDADPDNGCMSMVPGSHAWGDAIEDLHAIPSFDQLPERHGEHAVRAVACPVRAGHVHFHHAYTWHGSPANRSGRPRRAIALHFMTDRTRFIAAGQHLLTGEIEAEDGGPVRGKLFPVVYQRSATAVAAVSA